MESSAFDVHVVLSVSLLPAARRLRPADCAWTPPFSLEDRGLPCSEVVPNWRRSQTVPESSVSKFLTLGLGADTSLQAKNSSSGWYVRTCIRKKPGVCTGKKVPETPAHSTGHSPAHGLGKEGAAGSLQKQPDACGAGILVAHASALPSARTSTHNSCVSKRTEVKSHWTKSSDGGFPFNGTLGD